MKTRPDQTSNNNCHSFEKSKCHLSSANIQEEKNRTNSALFKTFHTFFSPCPAVSGMLKGTGGLSSGPFRQRAEMDSGD